MGQERKRRRIDRNDSESYFVIVGGDSQRCRREFQHTSVPFIGSKLTNLDHVVLHLFCLLLCADGDAHGCIRCL